MNSGGLVTLTFDMSVYSSACEEVHGSHHTKVQ